MNFWFPIGYKITNEYNYKKPKYESESWQIIEYDNSSLLLVNQVLFNKWTEKNLLEDYMFDEFVYSNEIYYFIESGKDNLLRPVEKTLNFINDNDAISFSLALNKTREKLSEDISLHDGIFIEKYSLILPIYSLAEYISDDYVLGNWITGGINVSVNSTRRILQLTGFKQEIILKISKNNKEIEVEDIYQEPIKKDSKEIKLFSLPGRPELESFFNENVIDIINNKERYKALGIGFPSAVILYGPPGSGKTYAVEQLINLLNWPSFRVESSSIASPYIHETSKKVAEIFQKAIENAPSVLVIDEMEAFLSNRDNTQNHHTIEEMAEFLRRIPEATVNEVLIIAMTNKLDMIDPAILRRGRFDHIINVDYASTQEIESMLNNSFEKISVENGIDVKSFAKELSGKPLSDVAFFVKEGARLAARSGKDKLDNDSLDKALEITLNKTNEKSTKKMGFI
jgi:AAA+ superfamily predicted ATPase